MNSPRSFFSRVATLASAVSLALPFAMSGATPTISPQEEIATQVPAARAILDAWQATTPQRAERYVHLVYWTPSDREPAPHYRERLSKIFDNVREFYAQEMERNGFGPRTIRLVKEADGLSRIHLVHGAAPYASYGRESGGRIRKECVPVLRAAGLDPENETIVIFCNMSNWDPDQRIMSQNSPYYASGTNQHGTAWQVDSPLLDLDLIKTTEPPLKDGEYGRISPGRYNSIFIGGVAHELGHALGMPHDCERPDQAALWGTALMGSGNRHYHEEWRHEGQGSFLTLSEAMRLASHPIFSGSTKGMETKANARIQDVKIEPQGNAFTFSGRVIADPPVYAVIGAMDPAGNSNYDATTATAVPDKEGRFTLHCSALKAGKSGVFHVFAAQANGVIPSFASFGGEPQFPYFVNPDGTVDLSASQAALRLTALSAAVNSGNAATAQAEFQRLCAEGLPAAILPAARSLVATIQAKPEATPAEAQSPACSLSTAAVKEAKVGWGVPVSNRLPGDNPLLIAGGRLFDRGLYAHAPARHVWTLGGKWTRLTGKAAMADGHDGTVICSILADGRELWHSKKMTEGDLESFDLNVKDAAELEFKVTEGKDDNRSAWGVWLEPTLLR